MAAEDVLADATWQNISWRTGTKGKLKARFAAVRVRVADGPPQRYRGTRVSNWRPPSRPDGFASKLTSS